jgi:hypothetical protein
MHLIFILEFISRQIGDDTLAKTLAVILVSHNKIVPKGIL